MKRDYSKAYENKNKASVDPNTDLKTDPKTDLNTDSVVDTKGEEIESAPEPEVVEEPKKKEAKVTKPFMVEITGNLNLNVRRRPMGDIVTSLAPGAQAKVLDTTEDDEWYQIESPKGFIMKKFTKKAR